MKTFLRIFFVLLMGTLFYGLYYKGNINREIGDKIIGFSVLISAFLFLPLFLCHRWKGKRLQDYTLTEENLRKMREGNPNIKQTSK